MEVLPIPASQPLDQPKENNSISKDQTQINEGIPEYCDCGEKIRHTIVRKEGPYQNRKYFRCPLNQWEGMFDFLKS